MLLWLAFSGGAILLERATSRAQEQPTLQYREDKEWQNDVLRPEERTIPQESPALIAPHSGQPGRGLAVCTSNTSAAVR
jgi:hypothetical protein